MMRPAFWFGAMVAAVVFVRLTYVGGQGALDRCYVLPEHPGAIVCGARLAHAAPLEGAATVETILAGPLPTALPTPNHAAPLPSWLPAGVLSWEAEIRTASSEAGLDPLALAAVMATECPSGNDRCLSPAGARGLLQVMPETARHIQLATGIPCADNPFDGLTSLRCGAWYLVECLKAANDLWQHGVEGPALGVAAAGYNGGPGFIPGMVAKVRAGSGVCESHPYAESRRECQQVLDVWHRAGRK